MKNKVIFLVTIIIIIIMIIFNQTHKKSNQLSSFEKMEDFNIIYENIKSGYPYLGIDDNSKEWIENKDKYIKRIKLTKNDNDFVKELSEIISELGNKHTEVIDNKKRYEMFKKSYSKKSEYDFLNDSRVIDRYNKLTHNIKNYKVSFFKKELTLKDVVNGKVGYIYIPSMTPQNGSISKDIDIIYNYLKERKNYDALILDIRGNKGGINKYWESIVSKIIDKDITINGYRFFKSDNNLIKGFTYSEKIKLNDINTLNINIDKKIYEKFNSYENTSYTIKSENNLNFKGKIYLIIDKDIYSSSDFFAMFCKNTKFATLIGEETSGDGGVLDPVLFKLPNSDLVIRMCSCMYLNKDSSFNKNFKTTPHFKVNAKRTKDFRNDKCIIKVLELEGIDKDNIL